MTPDEQLELFAQFDEDQLFTAATQLMWRIYDEVVQGDEEAVHGDLPSAIDDLSLGPWHEVDATVVAVWPYAMECRLLSWLLARLESVSTRPGATEAVVTARWLLLPSSGPAVGAGLDRPRRLARADPAGLVTDENETERRAHLRGSLPPAHRFAQPLVSTRAPPIVGNRRLFPAPRISSSHRWKLARDPLHFSRHACYEGS